jgi:hypothetical protein
MSATVRVLFCATVAVLAAAVADPLVEFASNAGLFGHATFTDKSNLDVLPALCVSGIFVLAAAFLRARSVLSPRLKAASDSLTPASFAQMLPAIFVLQIAVLFLMETLEQFAVYGHPLGGTIWLGGPVAVSLCVHALFCICAGALVARSMKSIAHSVVRLVRVFRAFVTLCAHGPVPQARNVPDFVFFAKPAPVACRIGERAPPIR